MLLGLVFSSLLALALGQCPPTAPPPNPHGSAAFIVNTQPNGEIKLECPPNTFPYGNLGAGGPLLVEMATSYRCDPATGKLTIVDTGKPSKLTTAICRTDNWDGVCKLELLPENTLYGVDDKQTISTDVLKCAQGRAKLSSGEEVTSMRCDMTEAIALLADGSEVKRDPLSVECAEVTTTTTTTTTVATTTTTTVRPDAPATANQLWNVNYYYNYGFGVHAYCADQTCINAIQSNGIGYDMRNGWGLMGRAVAESMINSIRASCRTGSSSLRNLGFTKSGKKYLHNLNGSGLKQGWVSISNGACGARVAIKRWKSRFTDDMMYGTDLEWNTWYKGMVQDGGQVQFYMWA